MVGILPFFLHISLLILFISSRNKAETANELVTTCKIPIMDNSKTKPSFNVTISGWDWEVRNRKNETYFINICGTAKNCGKDVSVCKKKSESVTINYGTSLTKDKIKTSQYAAGFSITFTGQKGEKTDKCTTLQTQINFQCIYTLGSPELVDDSSCIIIIQFFTKEACSKIDTIPEIPCVVFDDNKQKIDLSPLIKLKGGHQVSNQTHGVTMFINVCRDIKNDPKIQAKWCADGVGKSFPACRLDIKKPIGKITNKSKLIYDVGGKINLVYKYNPKSKECPNGVSTEITFMCQRKFSDGGTGPVLITDVGPGKIVCKYDILWRTGHACPNNDVITSNCKFSNNEVTFDLTKLEKPTKQLSYKVIGRNNNEEFRIKVCSNGQPCGSDTYGDRTAVCQILDGSKSHRCGNAKNPSIRYADGDLTMVYKDGEVCSTKLPRRTIITFRCDPTVDVGEPTFVGEEHCYYFFQWRTRHVCPSRNPGACSVISGNTYDLSILTKTDKAKPWLAVNSRSNAKGYTYYINVCGSVGGHPECQKSGACEVKDDGKVRAIGMYNSSIVPTISKSEGLTLVYTGPSCEGFNRIVTTKIKFRCKTKDLESPPELESRSWDGCDYIFTWDTAAACSLQVVNGVGCFLEDSVTGNVYDLSPLGKGPSSDTTYFTATLGDTSYNIQICGKTLADKFCGNRATTGICQKSKGDVHAIGSGQDNLFYYDGVLKMVFKNGDKCKSYITFFCDESAGTGSPVFVEEKSCVYYFVWYTKHACPLKTMECALKDKHGNEYDLSPLVRTKDNWKVKKNGKTYFINICRVLHRNNDTKSCPVRSSACMVSPNKPGVDMGEIVGPFTLDNLGNPVLQYQNNKNRTIITFICDPEGKTGSPEWSNSDEKNNIYSFTWKTKEACKIKPKVEYGCNDKDTGLSVLSKGDGKGYEIPLLKGKISLDICQNITCNKKKDSTACFIDGEKEFSIGRRFGSKVEHSDGVITLIYPGGQWKSTKTWGGYYTTKINFVCTEEIVDGKPVFIKQEENVYVIEFRTSLVCEPKDVQCDAYDKKQRYNLSPLTLRDGNWMAEDTRSHLDYYINVCSGYYPEGVNPKCKGSAGIGGCQVDRNHEHSHSMGLVQSRPIVSSINDVTLRYQGGDICHQKYHRSTRINFFCSNVHGSPVYMAEMKDCEYVFNWRTPSACPVKTFQGKDCRVYDETNGVYFDLRSLAGQVQKEEVDKGVQYIVKFCVETPAKDLGCGKDNPSCLNGTVTTGLKFSNMIFNDGKAIFEYTSKSINVTNEISCDSSVKTLSFREKAKVKGGYHLSWASSLVCPPVTGEECSITTEDGLFDLSVLAKESWNWHARNALDGEPESPVVFWEFYFSVCTRLKNISGPANRGSRGAIEDKDGKITSLGTMIERLKISDGSLTMTYGNGDKLSFCTNQKSPKTTIQFICDDIVPGGVGVGPVVDGFDKDQCTFHVTWTTRAACPVRSLLGDYSNPNCTAIHPATRKAIDLSQLKNTKSYTVVDEKNGDTYFINICARAKGCPANSGICKKGGKTSAGNVNTTLVYRQGFLYLHYKDGSACSESDKRTSETLISFICDAKAGKGKPKLERVKDCTHFVTWRTNLACEAEIDCVAQDGKNFYDLTPLIRDDANYESLDKDGKLYLINVCRSLVSDSRCSSQSSAAVCRTASDNKEDKSFGQVGAPPKFLSSSNDKQNEVKAQLIYENGECGNTTINFHCDPKDLAVRKLIITYADECSVQISWWTSLVCDPPDGDPPEGNLSCFYSNPEHTFCFDLKKLGQKGKNVKFTEGEVHFHVCGTAAKDCHEEGKDATSGEACLKTKNGKPTALSRDNIVYKNGEVRITYGKDVVLILYCGKDSESNNPRYIGKVEHKSPNYQTYYFSLITPEVCPPRELSCEIRYGDKTFNLAGLSRGENFYAKGDESDHYWLSPCGHVRRNKETEDICSSRATAIRVSSDKESEVIAVDTNYDLTYHAKTEYPLQLRYYGNEALKSCGNKKPTVVHKFKCRHGDSEVHFKSGENCEFVFLWKTAEACPENSKPLKQEGDDWIFYDDKTAGCTLDLTHVKKIVEKHAGSKDCKLQNKVTVYALDDSYELFVSCDSKKTKEVYSFEVLMRCTTGNETTLVDVGDSYVSIILNTNYVCDALGSGCAKKVSRSMAKSAAAVIGTLTGIGLLAAIIFFVWKPEKRQSAALWLRWHYRKYICCKRSYNASYRYKKVKTDEEDGETDYIIEAGAGGSLFSDDSDDDDYRDDDHEKNHNTDDDDLLPLDDDLLSLE
ncbi:cation-independent mannose-6-phosphate receptor-like [Dendronephthya gigantea]|uniref:cation-independent mannose-6-phosphate receptor-like n=1 Tax=Dendronephthya gigantea TaxID=151771 RepID=UPI00106C1D37|nr:cation-independent mannose-6-phosphate receptor-like [Dendronephthya gigantea]